MKFEVAVHVMPKEGISDPQGQTIERALPTQGFAGIEGVRVGKRIEFVIVPARGRPNRFEFSAAELRESFGPLEGVAALAARRPRRCAEATADGSNRG